MHGSVIAVYRFGSAHFSDGHTPHFLPESDQLHEIWWEQEEKEEEENL